jgi:hypothetical protein
MPALLERFSSLFGKLTPATTPAQKALADVRADVDAISSVVHRQAPAGALALLYAGPEALQRDVLIEAAMQLSPTPQASPEHVVAALLLSAMLARKLTFDSKSATRLVRAASRPGFMRTQSVLDVLRLVETVPPPVDNELRSALNILRALAATQLRHDQFQKLAIRLEPLLGAHPLKAGGPYSEAVFDQLTDLPREEAEQWREVFKIALLCTGARPTKKWVEQMRVAVTAIDPDVFLTRARTWLQLGPTPGGMRGAFVPDTDAAYLRGLLFAIGVAQAAPLASDVGAFALSCYRKIPQRGPVSQAAGNACLWTLGEVGLDGVGQLGRLKTRVKYTVALRLIEKALEDAAQRAGLSAEDLEEIGVPTCDLDEHAQYAQQLGELTARIEVKGDAEVSLQFVTASGKAQKSAPGELKGTPELKELKARMKDTEAMLAAQRQRLERLFFTDRAWPFTTWSSRFLNHPLLQNLARRLIWQIEGGATFAFENGQLVNAKHQPLQPKSSDLIRLWHPLDAADEGWGHREDVQPFKQWGRETFELNEHELTGGFTTRFAGRRIQQNRFGAMCRERGWQYRMQGEFDSANDAVLLMPKWELTVELEIAPPRTTGTSYMGLYLEVESGDVRFLTPSAQPPARILSEVMRDVAQLVDA